MSPFTTWVKRSLTDLGALLKFLVLCAMVTAVLTVASKWVAAATRLPGVVSFIMVGIIALIIKHNTPMLRPAKNKHIANYKVVQEETRRTTTINGIRLHVVSCICTQYDVWAGTNGGFVAEITMRTLGIGEAESYGLHFNNLDDRSLTFVTSICRHLGNDPDRTLMPLDCLIGPHGYAIGIGSPSTGLAYMR